MNSFTLVAVGSLVRDPESVSRGAKSFTRFCLTGTDVVGKDEGGGQPREVVSSVCFAAFGAIGEVIARHSKKGDQLIIEARLSTHVDKQSERTEHTFIVQGFRFGCPGRTKREEAAQTEPAPAAVPVAAQP